MKIKEDKFWPVLIADPLFWLGMYAAIVLKSEGAENVLTFVVSALFAIMLVAGLAIVSDPDVVEHRYAPRPKWRQNYHIGSSIVEACFFAYGGFFGLATMHLLTACFSSEIREKLTARDQ